MGSSKLLEHGMNTLRTFFSRMVLRQAKPILLSSFKEMEMISLYAKSMLMTVSAIKLLSGFW
jgi:hypothetical protein